MSITTYTELKDAIASWMNREDLTLLIPTFIALAEADFNRTLRVRQMVARATTDMSGEYTVLPDDFLEMISLEINSSPSRKLEPILEEELQIRKRQRGDITGIPQAFTIVGNDIQVEPAPNQTFTVKMNYYVKITPLSDSNSSNWLLAKHPDLYLMGALMHASNYVWEDERTQMIAATYSQLMDRIRDEERNAVLSGGTPRQKFRALG